ncbi:hypothetical protein [Sandarakinorhabdus sp.]|uniref:hypothetical protein n=1 Tax=Sandarakinorhabdus sp. TaxID=1916663 RepID=UPI00286E650F|nr:hypothetical protein [Sandarakinorhabdus sp.]
MPISFAKPPAAMAANLAAVLPRLAASANLEARAPAITRGAARMALGDAMRMATTLAEVRDADAIATPVYMLGLDDLAAGRIIPGAKLKLWAQIVPTEAGAVSAEARASDSRFAQMSNGISVGRFRNALTRMAAAPPADDGEVAQLRIPALHITCLWLKGGKAGDRFEVVDAPAGVLPIGQIYSAAELAAALKTHAASRMANREADG